MIDYIEIDWIPTRLRFVLQLQTSRFNLNSNLTWTEHLKLSLNYNKITRLTRTLPHLIEAEKCLHSVQKLTKTLRDIMIFHFHIFIIKNTEIYAFIYFLFFRQTPTKCQSLKLWNFFIILLCFIIRMALHISAIRDDSNHFCCLLSAIIWVFKIYDDKRRATTDGMKAVSLLLDRHRAHKVVKIMVFWWVRVAQTTERNRYSFIIAE